MGSDTGVVTLLFTDLVGSTEVLTRLGDDAAERLRQVHFGLLRQSIDESGGREVKALGDGVMAVFASPVGALRCAVSIQVTVAQHNGRYPDAPLQVRVGLHAGEPVEAEGDFHGMAVVVAKRLCDEAQGGEILASQLLRDLVGTRGGFVFRPAGRLELKGLTTPLPSVAVEWARSEVNAPARSLPNGIAIPRGLRLVGRDKELAAIEEELARAAAGEFRCVLLLGEPGIGKSRLAWELLARHSDAVTGLAARAHRLGATTDFGLWAEALERHLRGLEPEEIACLCAGFLDDLARLLRSVAAVRVRSTERDPPRSRLLEGLAVVLTNLAAVRPVVVVIDDIHLSDPSSLEALHYLAYTCTDARLLIVATARVAELSEQAVIGEVVLGLEQEGLLRRFVVDRLEPHYLSDLAEAAVGAPVPPALVDWLENRSQGNPLFALGLLQALRDEHADLSAPVLRRLPETLSERVSSRLRQLDEPAVSLLELLAVLGRRVELRSLVALSGHTPADLAGLLERLARSRLVSEEERGLELVYEISHPLVQDSIYQGMGAARRRSLHREVGRGLISSGRVAEAAPHFVRSAEPGDSEAITVLCGAVHQAEHREAFQEAIAILGALVELLPAGDPQWVQIAESLYWGAQWVMDHRADNQAVLCLPALRAMDQALDGVAHAARRAEVKLRLATFLAWGAGELEQAEEVAREALVLFQDGEDHRGELITRNELGLIAALRGDPRAYWQQAHEVVEETRVTGDDVVLTRALRSLGAALVVNGRYNEARTALEEAMEAARTSGDVHAMAMSLSYSAIGLASEGQVQEAERVLGEARRLNPKSLDSLFLEHRGFLPWTAGNYPLAVQRGREAVAAFPGGLSRRRGAGMVPSALAALEMGLMSEAERFLSLARAPYGHREWWHFSDLVSYGEAVLTFRQGRRTEGAALLRRSVKLLLDKALGATVPFFLQLPEWIEQADLAIQAANALDELAREIGTEFRRALASLGRASASAAVGDTARATVEAREAVNLLSPLETRGYLACALELLGRVLVHDDRPGAVVAFRQAAELFERCGATWRRDTVVMRLQAARAATSDPFELHVLTEREREVSDLAAQGFSAREIGEQLFIGKRTVEGHLARAYDKLGVRSKVELARRAAEFGLGSSTRITNA